MRYIRWFSFCRLSTFFSNRFFRKVHTLDASLSLSLSLAPEDSLKDVSLSELRIEGRRVWCSPSRPTEQHSQSLHRIWLYMVICYVISIPIGTSAQFSLPYFLIMLISYIEFRKCEYGVKGGRLEPVDSKSSMTFGEAIALCPFKGHLLCIITIYCNMHIITIYVNMYNYYIW